MFEARSSGRDASRGLTPSERRKPSASSSSWPGRAHGHGDRLPVDADLERLLDGQLVPLRLAVWKPQDVGSGRGVRRQGVHYDRTIDVLKLTELLPELPTERTKLLDNLGRVRREVGPVTPELSDAIADHMNIRRGEVDEVVSFYSFLRVPMDAVRVCIGPVCDCLGAKDLLAREQEKANGVPVLGVECLGHCDLAPVLLRGDEVEPEVVYTGNDGASRAWRRPTRRSPTTRPAAATRSCATSPRASGSSRS